MNIDFFFSVVTTSTPHNEAELQLYRVLQRASLLAYYDTLLEMGMNRNQFFCKTFLKNIHSFYQNLSKRKQTNLTEFELKFYVFSGGDDVQQLCDAGEDEFLEIMALVGMASKPLHVRRFQKALAEWVSNPASFKVPLSNIGEFNCPMHNLIFVFLEKIVIFVLKI